MFFVHGSNGHDYFLVGHAIAQSYSRPPRPLFRVCMLDINDGTWFGEGFPTPKDAFALDDVNYRSDRFEIFSTTKDNTSSLVCKSKVEGAEFDFAISPRGPNLYAGGSGTFFWGTDWTYQMSYPEMWVTGTFKYKGETVSVVSEKSMAWLDRQYGVGLAGNGWDLYMLIFENGMKASIWRSEACPPNTKQYMATILYPDSHHEVYPLDDHVEHSQPYVSKDSGYLYHARHVITIPGLDARIEMQQPWPVGEMTIKGAPHPNTTLFEGYVNVNARIRGEEVKGWGVAERRVPDREAKKAKAAL